MFWDNVQFWEDEIEVTAKETQLRLYIISSCLVHIHKIRNLGIYNA